MRVVWDESQCASVGMCESVAPSHFEIGDDGALRVLVAEPAEADRAQVQAAVRSCPTGALRLEG